MRAGGGGRGRERERGMMQTKDDLECVKLT